MLNTAEKQKEIRMKQEEEFKIKARVKGTLGRQPLVSGGEPSPDGR